MEKENNINNGSKVSTPTYESTIPLTFPSGSVWKDVGGIILESFSPGCGLGFNQKGR